MEIDVKMNTRDAVILAEMLVSAYPSWARPDVLEKDFSNIHAGVWQKEPSPEAIASAKEQIFNTIETYKACNPALYIDEEVA